MGVKGARKEGALHTLMTQLVRSTRESLIQDISRMRESGRTTKEIVKELNRAGIISPRGFKITTSNVRNYIKCGYESGVLKTTRLDGKPPRFERTQSELPLKPPVDLTPPQPGISTDLSRVMDVIGFTSRWTRAEAISTLQQALAILTNLPTK